MSDDVQFFDDEMDSPDSGGSVAVAESDESQGEQDSFGDMQDRMSEDDGFWRSDSEGKVVDREGNIVIDEKTGRDFNSMEELEAFKKQQSQQNTAKPKTEEVKKPDAPMSKSFDMYAKGDGDLTPERFQELAQIGQSYKYQDELLPKIDTAAKQAQAEQIDPIERVKTDRQNWEAIAIKPIESIRQKLIDQGADPVLVDELIAPERTAQSQLVEERYREAIEKAQLEKVEGLYKPQLTKLEQEKQNNVSNSNIDSLSKAYFPQGGKDQYFALINGYKNENGEFVRGPAAQLLDAFVHVATDGKPFSSDEERAKAYQDTHSKITANPVMAKVLFDLAYTHWLGKNAVEAKKIGFQAGKQSALKEQSRINRTIKTRPANFQAPNTMEDDGNAPQLLRAAMGLQGRR